MYVYNICIIFIFQNSLCLISTILIFNLATNTFEINCNLSEANVNTPSMLTFIIDLTSKWGLEEASAKNRHVHVILTRK